MKKYMKNFTSQARDANTQWRARNGMRALATRVIKIVSSAMGLCLVAKQG